MPSHCAPPPLKSYSISCTWIPKLHQWFELLLPASAFKSVNWERGWGDNDEESLVWGGGKERDWSSLSPSRYEQIVMDFGALSSQKGHLWWTSLRAFSHLKVQTQVWTNYRVFFTSYTFHPLSFAFTSQLCDYTEELYMTWTWTASPHTCI